MAQQGHELMSMAELPGLGRYVQARRHDLDLRYDELATRIGVNVAWLYWLEDDVLPAIELSMLVQLAIALEVDQAILMHYAHLPPDHTVLDQRQIDVSGPGGQRPAMARDVAAEGE
jgi:transcriptional regulator with XRE-family HTH domain